MKGNWMEELADEVFKDTMKNTIKSMKQSDYIK